MRKKRRNTTRMIPCVMAATVFAGTAGNSLVVLAEKTTELSQEAEKVTFSLAPAGHPYEGMPLFDGNPDHYEQYLDTVIDYIGLEGAARLAFDTRGDYTLTMGENAGKTIPGALNFTDCVQGVSTDLPAIIGLGQTWNKSLVKDAGEVIGNEKISKTDYSDLSKINVMACTAVSDLRINPLSGRFDEDFSEDTYLTSVMVDEMATGASGIEEEENEDGFWQKAAVMTKHYTNYSAQAMRSTNSNNVSARGLLEYQSQNAVKGFESGALAGFMTSYGNTNGIPNFMSPLINAVKSKSPYGLYTLGDNGAISAQKNFSNGYDSAYALTESGKFDTIGASMAIANAAGASPDGGDFWTLVNQVNAGTYGVTRSDVEEVAKDQLGQLVRCGVLNDDLTEYPFYDQSSGQTSTVDYTNEDHQEVALKTAQESVVLLKNNDNVLPLDKGSSVYVSGPMAETRFQTTYATNTPEDLENGGLTIAQGIQAIGGENVQASSDCQVVNIKTSSGKYIALADAENGDLTLTDNQEEAAKFEKYSWGQAEGYSYWCVDNGKWLKTASSGGGWGSSGTVTGIKANGTESLIQGKKDLTAIGTSASMPTRLRLESNDDGTFTYVLNSYSESFTGTSSIQGYYTSGVYLTADDSAIGISDKLTNAENAATIRTETTKFTEEIVSDYGAATNASDSEYAVVVVGAPARHSSGEGCDRSDMALGEGQYEQVEKVAAEHPGKTIVIVQTNYPEIIQEIEDNPNVAAIVTQPYGGQYGSYAMGQILYGDATPTGKLSATWYNTNEVLPEISEYSLPTNSGVTVDSLDPRFQYDMTNADPAETDLTYMYTDSEYVTYEFGYGLSYSDFAYSNLCVPGTISSNDESFEVKVTVTNTGSVATSDVAQIYISNDGSAYGDSAPQKKLVGFEKVYLQPDESKEIALNIETSDFALWNTNTNNYIVEAGTYTIQVGNSSENILLNTTLTVTGESMGELDASTEPVNVYDASYAIHDVVYKEVSKANTAESLEKANADSDENAMSNVAGGYYAVVGKGDGSWSAMNDVNLDYVTSIKANVATDSESGIIEFHADSPDGILLGQLHFGATGVNTYTALENGENPDAAEDITVNELSYVEKEVALETTVEGIHDVYVVFKTKDARIDTVQFVKEVPDIPEVNKEAFTSVLNAAKEKVESDYTVDSWSAFKVVLDEAIVLDSNADATQEEIDEMTERLTNAMNELKFVEENSGDNGDKDAEKNDVNNDDKNDKASGTNTTVKTGDTENIALAALVTGISFVIAVILIVKKYMGQRRRNFK